MPGDCVKRTVVPRLVIFQRCTKFMRLLPISILIFPMPCWPKRQEILISIRRKLIFLPLKMVQEVSSSLICVWRAHKEEPVG
ncbi:MAG TPA: hypothetical protein DCK79_11045 [Candidatus Atribacteria bacterium]|nr:hypothetical protein [Candidatus Atribacteria bacterium]